MQSTGEVIGIHEDARVALAKALRGAGLIPSLEQAGSFAEATEAGAHPAPIALLSIADRDKAELPRLAAALDRAGFRVAATPGTRAAILAAGLEADPVAKLGAEPDATAAETALLELITGGRVRLVVNTPTPRSGAIRDAAEIRHTAIAEGVPCLTAIETAIAAAEALDPDIDAQVADVRSLTDRVPGPPQTPRRGTPAAGANRDEPDLVGSSSGAGR
jgi:carbamoyl-phosphate synthase large subunit